jgi:hypothetical protein
MARRYDEGHRREPYRGERGYARDERGFDPRAGSERRSELDEEDVPRRRGAGEAERRRPREARPFVSPRLWSRFLWVRIRATLAGAWVRIRLSRRFRPPRSDTRIREDVCDRLTDAPFLDARDVEVTVNKGEVTRTGTVPTRQHARGGEDLIEHVIGVRAVHNDLRVSRTAEGTNVGR